MSTNGDMPAMPQLHMIDGNWVNDPLPKHAGLTKREHACIALRVPETGDPELDALIRTAHRRDVAAMALQGIVGSIHSEYEYQRIRSLAQASGISTVSEWIARDACKQADALLAALRAEVESLRNIKRRASAVVAYDWSENDDDAVHAVRALRDAIDAARKVEGSEG